MNQEKINRINELAKKSKTAPLTAEEAKEQKELREEYLRDFRAQFTGILDNTVIRYPDGREESVKNRKK